MSVENGADVSSKTTLPMGVAANAKQNVGDGTFKSYEERDPTKVTVQLVSLLVSKRRKIRPPKMSSSG